MLHAKVYKTVCINFHKDFWPPIQNLSTSIDKDTEMENYIGFSSGF